MGHNRFASIRKFHPPSHAGLRITSAVLLVALAAWGCTPNSNRPAAQKIMGNVLYRERIMLPPEATITVTLEDVSRADAPSVRMAQTTLKPQGGPPFPFSLEYDPAQITAGARYCLRARIDAHGQLLFTSTDFVDPFGAAAGRVVDLLVRAAGRTDATRQTLRTGTFAGTLPCADCAGIRHILALRENNVFFLRLEYLGQGADRLYDDIGTWSISSDGGTLVLHGGRESSPKFAILSPDSLRQLDVEGRHIDSPLPYELVRAVTTQPFEPRLRMRGMYRYQADAGFFAECLTGLRLPVAQEADNAAIERAYSEARRTPGEEVLAILEGRIVERPPMEGDGVLDMLVVEQFGKFWPGESCGPRHSRAELTNTYWKLVRLGEESIVVAPQQREPHLKLETNNRLGGFSGCNRFMGAWQLEGETLRFTGIATTRMACPAGMEQEAAFVRALESMSSWKIMGEHLEFFDTQGALLARFESRYME